MDSGQALKAIRKRRNLTQVQLAEASGVDQTVISHIECGGVQTTPSWFTVFRLARALEVRPEDIFPVEPVGGAR